MNSPQILTVSASKLEEAVREFYGHSPRRSVYVDQLYAIPSKHWLLNIYAPEYRRALSVMGVQFYDEVRNDCDDYASSFRVNARIIHATNRQLAPGKHTLSVGEMAFHAKGAGGIHGYHMASQALVWNAKKKQLEFITIEPQTQLETILKPIEKSSCDYSYF